MDLAKVRRNFLAESDELGILSAALRVVYDDLEVVQSEGTSSLMVMLSRSQLGCASSRRMLFTPGSISPS